MIDIFATKAQRKTKSHLSNLVAMAKADGDFHVKEKKYIRRIGLRNGLDDEQITDLMFETSNAKIEIPQRKKERFFQLLDFVKLMKEDGHISEQERNLFRGLVHQLEFNKTFAGLISEKIERGLEEGLSKGQLFARCITLLD